MEDVTFESGDMSPEHFRIWGHRLIDWVADYLKQVDRFPVLAQVEPGQIKSALPGEAPRRGETMERIMEDFERLLLPGITHWNHPAFFGYFSITGSAPGILAELLCSALNVNAMLWKTSPAATELEEVTLSWLRKLLGLPEEFWGIIYDTASISTFHAIAAARESTPGLEVRRKGLTVGTAGRRLRLYTSEQAHSSVEKAALALGIGQEGVARVATDNEFRMDPAALETEVQRDLAGGALPFCVVATLGTTSTASLDPILEIEEICRRYKLWLHADAAYAGSAALTRENQKLFQGWDKADSVVVNPHKWLFTPLDLSVFYCRNPEALRDAFSLTPEYLKTDVDDQVTNFMDYGVQLGRRFRALKLWMVIRYFGAEGLAQRIQAQIDWARQFAAWIADSSDFELMAPTTFSLVCFRLAPPSFQYDEQALEALNRALLDSVNGSGQVLLSHTRLKGKFVLRLAIGNLKTELRHVERAWEVVQSEAARLKGKKF